MIKNSCSLCQINSENRSSAGAIKKAQSRFVRTALWVGIFLVSTTLFSLVFAHHPDEGGSESKKSSRVFSLSELASFDGKEGHLAYIAYDGKIYDVTGSFLFEVGEPPFEDWAGQDLTGKIDGVLEAEEVLANFPVVGVLEGFEEECTDECSLPADQPSWGPIIILGKSLTAWTGYLLGIFFVLNYGTCFAMPWAREHLPWKGKIPGPDVWDSRGFLFLNTFHRPFAYLTVFLGLVHGILGILHSFGIVI